MSINTFPKTKSFFEKNYRLNTFYDKNIIFIIIIIISDKLTIQQLLFLSISQN